jgi:hypothetical protein
MTELFELTELQGLLRDPGFDSAAATVARRIAYGWLKSATKLTDWPAVVTDDLFAWAIELAAIAYRNPAAASSESIDDYNVSYDRERRAEILAAAAAGQGGSSQPQYDFPDPDWHWDVVPPGILTIP